MAKEIGYVTDPNGGSWGGLGAVGGEQNPALTWPNSVAVFNKMRSEDAQIASVLRALTSPILGAAWAVDPAGARDEVVDLVATDLGLPVKGRPPEASSRPHAKFSWPDHLRLALLSLSFGHSVFEQVVEVVDGRVRLRKLAFRPHETIEKFVVARDGGLVAIEQAQLDGKTVRIPVDRLVVHTNEREGGNWQGRSLLRAAYKNWLLKDRMLRAQALTVERNGLGVPVYTGAPVPDGATLEQRDEWLRSEQESGLELVKGFRAGENAGAALPNGAELKLLGVTGKLPPTDEPIRFHDEQIARAVLAHFLNLGTETGSWALGSTFANFFTQSLNAVATQVASVTQQHVVEDLVTYNWGADEVAPQVVCEPIGSEHPVTAEGIRALVDCGVLTPDDELEAHMRQLLQLPVKSKEGGERGTGRNVVQD